jgi:shikimate dehydrogenase
VEAFKRCDFLSDTALKTGSVNTVVRSSGKLYGYNTDYYGFAYMTGKLGVDFKDKKVVILGTGGACRTVKTACADFGAESTVIIGRKSEFNYDNLYLNYDADIIINTTPVGMYPNNGEAAVNISDFSKPEAVIDLIYNPAKTRLLIEAEKLGIPCINGLSMLVAQGLRSSELFFGKTYDKGLIEKALADISLRNANIVIIGMPGCGKSSVGKAVAEKLGREFTDTDSLIEASSGKSIPEIFANEGEEVFRDIETREIRECSKKLGNVTATGGGAVLREINRNCLKQNGIIVYLRRPIEHLSQNGRPLSSGFDAVKKLYEERKHIYETFADFTVDAGKSPQETAETIIERIGL